LYKKIAMLKISALSPIFFFENNDKTERKRTYFQKFSTIDNIYIQLYGNIGQEPILKLFCFDSGRQIRNYTFSEFQVNQSQSTFTTKIENINEGTYFVELFANGKTLTSSNPFTITSDESILDYTSLIRYYDKSNNNIFNTSFSENGKIRAFEIRVEAGMKNSESLLFVDNEFFRNQRQETIQLYSQTRKTELFTIGDAIGVPKYIGELINNVFCLSDVEINGKSYVRSENSIPELQVISERHPFFIYKMTIEEKTNEIGLIITQDYQRRLRITEDDDFRLTGEKDDLLRAV